MNLISQNCLSGNLYQWFLKEKFGNPFIWSVIDFNSMKYLIENWNTIDFREYDLVKDEKWNFSIVIDGNVKVQYVHYLFDANSPTIRYVSNPGNVYWNKIWEYIVQKYEERLDVMDHCNEHPIFCICNFNTIFKDAVYTEEQLSTLEQYDNVKVLRGCETLEPYPSAEIFYNTFLKFK